MAVELERIKKVFESSKQFDFLEFQNEKVRLIYRSCNEYFRSNDILFGVIISLRPNILKIRIGSNKNVMASFSLADTLNILFHLNYSLSLGSLKYFTSLKNIFITHAIGKSISLQAKAQIALLNLVQDLALIYETFIMKLPEIQANSSNFNFLRNVFRRNSFEAFAEYKLNEEKKREAEAEMNRNEIEKGVKEMTISSEDDDDFSYDDDEYEPKLLENGLIQNDESAINDIMNSSCWMYADEDSFNDTENIYEYNQNITLAERITENDISMEYREQFKDFLLKFYDELGYQFRHFPLKFMMTGVKRRIICSFYFAVIFENSIETDKEFIKTTSKTDKNYYIESMMKQYDRFIGSSISPAYKRQHLSQSWFELSELRFESTELDSSDLKIGSGGFSTIYKNIIDGYEVAIKIPSCTKEELENANQRILREFDILQKLSIDSVIHAKGLVKYKEKVCLVYELCEEGSLKSKISSLSGYQAIKIMQQVAEAMEKVHQQKVIHHDLKPSNILISKKQKPKISDFGLSYREGSQIVGTGFTTEYADPLQIKGKSPGKPADVWSFGMTMYHVFTRQSPFSYFGPQFFSRELREENKKVFIKRVLKEKDRPRIDENFTRNYPELVEIMVSCWDETPENRITFAEISARLKELTKNLSA